jgi:hypothetical protein
MYGQGKRKKELMIAPNHFQPIEIISKISNGKEKSRIFA